MGKRKKKEVPKRVKLECIGIDYPVLWDIYMEFASHEIDIFDEPERFSDYIKSVEPNRQGIVLTLMTAYMLLRRYPYLKAHGWVMWWQMGLACYSDTIMEFWKTCQAPARASEIMRSVIEAHNEPFKDKRVIQGKEVDDLHDKMMSYNDPFRDVTRELMDSVNHFIVTDIAMQGPPLFEPSPKPENVGA